MGNTIHFKLNPHKALEVIIWIANRDKNKGIDLYKLVKSILFADVYHLNNYGRTMYGDVYLAMDHGPVPGHAYEIIKKEPIAVMELDEVPIIKRGKAIKAARLPRLELLSKSDIEALNYGWSMCKNKSFAELKKAADVLPFYVSTWNARRSDNEEIDLADMLDDENKSKAAELREIAPSIAL
jgi:hypothetical protein